MEAEIDYLSEVCNVKRGAVPKRDVYGTQKLKHQKEKQETGVYAHDDTWASTVFSTSPFRSVA